MFTEFGNKKLKRCYKHMDFYPVEDYRLLEEELKTMGEYEIEDCAGGCVVFWGVCNG